MIDGLKVEGTITIYEGKKEKIRNVYKNAFLLKGKEFILDCLTNTTNDFTGYKYVGIGDGKTPVTPSDTKLVNERFRKEITQISREEDKIILDIYMENFEANFKWQEIGLFGNGEAGTLNSGYLLNRALLFEDKNDQKGVTISWEVKFI